MSGKKSKPVLIRVGEQRTNIEDEYKKMLNDIIDQYNLENPSQAIKFLIKKEHKSIQQNVG